MEYNINFVDGLRFELINDGFPDSDRKYDISFVEIGTNRVIYKDQIGNNMWCATKSRIFHCYIILQYRGRTVKQISVPKEMKGKRILINFDSTSLGDNLAWMPYCELFQKQFDCETLVCTHRNEFFEGNYPTLTFVPPKMTIPDLFGIVSIGWYWDYYKESTNPVTIPLQETAARALCVPFEELVPRINFTAKPRPIEQKYVCISVKSTSGCKEWDYWQELVDMLIADGYAVTEISKQEDDSYKGFKQSSLKGITKLDAYDLASVQNAIHHSEFMIGLSSGLSWLAWAMKKNVVMIANFSEEWHEFKTNCIRITNKNVCHGCWNDPRFKINSSDWSWCPINEHTSKAFECNKAISAKDVYEQIKRELF